MLVLRASMPSLPPAGQAELVPVASSMRRWAGFSHPFRSSGPHSRRPSARVLQGWPCSPCRSGSHGGRWWRRRLSVSGRCRALFHLSCPLPGLTLCPILLGCFVPLVSARPRTSFLRVTCGTPRRSGHGAKQCSMLIRPWLSPSVRSRLRQSCCNEAAPPPAPGRSSHFCHTVLALQLGPTPCTRQLRIVSAPSVASWWHWTRVCTGGQHLPPGSGERGEAPTGHAHGCTRALVCLPARTHTVGSYDYSHGT
mmetsp:Transcript_27377/g.56006  ORF Transcript_27377/g.56006 Transcript_27377/m.56006 type:complete len:252 (-) Transcript_27377:1486-2241(-)